MKKIKVLVSLFLLSTSFSGIYANVSDDVNKIDEKQESFIDNEKKIDEITVEDTSDKEESSSLESRSVVESGTNGDTI